MVQVIEGELFTTEELAVKLRLKPDTLHKWRQRDQGPRYFRIGARVYYHGEEVNEWLQQQREA